MYVNLSVRAPVGHRNNHNPNNADNPNNPNNIRDIRYLFPCQRNLSHLSVNTCVCVSALSCVCQYVLGHHRDELLLVVLHRRRLSGKGGYYGTFVNGT